MHLGDKFDLKEGKLTVSSPGVYYIYAQVTEPQNSFRIKLFFSIFNDKKTIDILIILLLYGKKKLRVNFFRTKLARIRIRFFYRNLHPDPQP